MRIHIHVNSKKIDSYRSAKPLTRLTEKLILNILGLESLENVDLSFANGVDLTGADMRDATLAKVDLVNTLLLEANLRYTIFWGVDLRNADFTGADLTEAIGLPMA